MDSALTMVQEPPKQVKKPGGTFASMGLSRLVLKAVERKGYKLATPIQRKCIPPIMTGRDVVAMARTGSGKSAAFLLPIIDRLKIRQPKSAVRALILSPTRELAMQTFKFAREFSKYTNLITKLIIGGESIGKDFETVTSSPDILIATPGRLAHVLIEMKHKLIDLEVVVFDEADRLFEPGFKEIEQVLEIISRLPETKQTLLFSATMPQKLADFAKVGLNTPEFVRLDVESNLSETLKSVYLHCPHNDKFAVLLHLLKNFVSKEQMTVVFMPTKHHIEYAYSLLRKARIDCCYVYSSLDPEARKINIDKFTRKHCRVMLVTDIAARGIDIPMLDTVINYNFPSKPKLFIHRVGRVARAGKFGCAISLVSHDETAYLHGLHIFLGMPLTVAAQADQAKQIAPLELTNLSDKVFGSVPQSVIDEENEILKIWHEHDDDLKSMVKVCDNAMKPYLKTRELPAQFSVKAAKDIHKKSIDTHPIYRMMSGDSGTHEPESLAQESNLLNRIKSYKPQATIFEVGHIKGIGKTEAFKVMQQKRQFHDKIAKKRAHRESLAQGDQDTDDEADETQDISTNVDVKQDFEDSKFYLKYQPDDYAKEKGLELDKSSFNRDLNRVTMDLTADDEDNMKRQKHQKVWDRKRKKYVNADQLDGEKKVKKIKTESGAYIAASYDSGLFEKWKKQSKFDQKEDDDDVDDNEPTSTVAGNKQTKRIPLDKLKAKLKPSKGKRRELQNTDQILKTRGIQEKREAILKRKIAAKANRFTSKSSGRGGPSKARGASNSKGGKSRPNKRMNNNNTSRGGDNMDRGSRGRGGPKRGGRGGGGGGRGRGDRRVSGNRGSSGNNATGPPKRRGGSSARPSKSSRGRGGRAS